MAHLTLLGLGMFMPLDDDGAPIPLGLVYFYETGTLTPKLVYHDADGGSAWTQPVELDGSGRAAIFLKNDGAYDVVLKTPLGVTVWTLTKLWPAAPVV